MNLQGIRLVTFDATNTILKFRVPPWEHYANVAREYGFQGSPKDLKPRILKSYKDTWNKYPNFGKYVISWEDWWRNVVKKTLQDQLPKNQDLDCIANRLIEEFGTTKCWYLDKAGIRLIQLLRINGIAVGVISNFDPRLLKILRHFKIDNCFDFVLTSYEVGYSKPDERIFDAALKIIENSVQPCNCVHIGDDVKKDYAGARAAGWHALLITENTITETPPAPNHVFKNLEELSLAIEKNTLRL